MVGTKDSRLAARIPSDLKKRLEKLADKAEQTLASYVTDVLEEHSPAPKKGKRK